MGCVFLVLACRAVRREVNQEQTAAARIQRHWRAHVEQRTLDAEEFELETFAFGQRAIFGEDED